MPNIYSTETVNLYTTVSGGIQPYDQCARWAGGWTANSGLTGTLQVGLSAPANTPYINSNNTPCASPGTSGGSLTGTLQPNGFTGNISVWVNVADSSGIFKESNTKTYTVEPVGALIVNAGPDYAISGAGQSIIAVSGATATGGVPQYTYLWTQTYPGNPERTFFTPGIPTVSSPGVFARSQSTALLPELEEFNSNGTYNFQLTATDNSGQTGTDNMQVVVTGATPPVLAPTAASIIWDTTLYDPGAVSLSFVIRKNGVNQVTSSLTDSGSLSGWISGQNISGSSQAIDLDGSLPVSVSWQISRQSRTFPYVTAIMATYVDCDNSTASASSINFPYDPAYQYRISGDSGFC